MPPDGGRGQPEPGAQRGGGDRPVLQDQPGDPWPGCRARSRGRSRRPRCRTRGRRGCRGMPTARTGTATRVRLASRASPPCLATGSTPVLSTLFTTSVWRKSMPGRNAIGAWSSSHLARASAAMFDRRGPFRCISGYPNRTSRGEALWVCVSIRLPAGRHRRRVSCRRRAGSPTPPGRPRPRAGSSGCRRRRPGGGPGHRPDAAAGATGVQARPGEFGNGPAARPPWAGDFGTSAPWAEDRTGPQPVPLAGAPTQAYVPGATGAQATLFAAGSVQPAGPVHAPGSRPRRPSGRPGRAGAPGGCPGQGQRAGGRLARCSGSSASRSSAPS